MTLRLARALAVGCALIAGCGEDLDTAPIVAGEPGDAAPADGAPDAAADLRPTADLGPDAAPRPCPITWTDPPAGPLAPGSRLRIDAAPGADLAAAGPDGFAVYPVGDTPDAWWVRVPYRAGPVELVVEARCAPDAVEAHTRAVEVAPLVWRPVARWDPDLGGPPGREYFGMWLDPVDRQRLWVYGGFHYRPAQFTPANDLWTYALDDGAWTLVEQDPAGPTVGGAGFAPLPGMRELAALGGVTGAPPDLTGVVGVSILRYGEAGPAAWSAVPFERPVRGDYQPALFAHGGRLLSVGGQGGFGVHLDGTWYALDGRDRGLLPLADETRPPGRVGFAWGVVGDRLAVFSGEQGGGPDGTCNCADDTWLLDLDVDPDGDHIGRWTRLEHPAQPPGRRNALFGVDPDGRRLFVWGGTADGRTSVPGLSVLHLESGAEAWVQLDVDAGPDGRAPVRSSGRAVYDPARGRMLFGFGNGDDGVHTDLWALDLGQPAP